MAEADLPLPVKPSLKRINTSAAILTPAEQRVTVSFSHLNAWVPVLSLDGGSTLPQLLKKGDVEAPPTEKQILFNIEGVVSPGHMLALMGPSGSGKSSLLTLLGGRTAARWTGDVLFNGKPLEKAMKRKMGFVTQDDLLFAELTTYETLYYAALLRLPRHWSREEKLERVEMVLAGLGLERCRDTIIGNHMMRGVSGGERKRVSIGHELLINPSVLFLDEPTSGLDSTTALKLIHTLRSLASGGRSIIASIHQPSSRLYQEFDKLLLLSEGHTMYYGDAQVSASWFAACGVPVPFGVSVPDHLLDLACGDIRGQSIDEGQLCKQRLITAWETRSLGTGKHGVQLVDYPAAGSSGDDTPSTPSASALASVATTPRKALEAGDAKEELQAQRHHKEYKWGATWLQQVSILTSRCVRTRRMSSLSTQRYAEVIIPGILAGLFWFQLGGSGTISKQDATDLSGLLFFQVLFMGFSSMFTSLFSFPSDFQMLVKERQSGMYRLTSYYVARTLSDIPMDCLIPSIFTIIIYWMSGLRISAGAFFANWATLILTVLVAQGAGLLISATVMNGRTALATATVLMLCIMLVGGFYVTNIPVWIRWLKYTSFIYYSYNLMLKIEFNHRGYDCSDFYADNPTAPPGQTWCSIKDGGIFDINVDSNPGFEAGLLIAMLILFRLLTYLALKHRTSS